MERPRPRAGDPAPKFLLRDQNGNQWSQEDFAQSWLVLFFYPGDDTPGCTTEVQAFRDARDRLEAAGAKIVGISTDTYSEHAKFSERLGVTYPLLSDAMHTTVEDYGVLRQRRHNGTIRYEAELVTFLIDPDGRIAKVYDHVEAERHPDEIVQDLQGLLHAAT